MFGFGKNSGRAMISAVTQSAVGLVREDNEDHLLADGPLGIYGVADGMGGGADGEKASEIVCAEVAMLLRLQPPEFAARMEAVCNAVICSNKAIYDYANAMRFDQMGTTVSLLLFDPEEASQAAICHVGDSRIYRFRRGKVRVLTQDHSVAAELGRRLGSASGLASRDNPLAHVLTRAIGTAEAVNPDWKRISVEPGDRYLLCTDGVHDMLDESDLLELAGAGGLSVAKRKLAQAVLDRGAPDNFSFVLLDVAEPAD